MDRPVVGQHLRSANGATTTRVSESRVADGRLELSELFLGDATSVVYILRELAAAPQVVGSSSTTRHLAVADAQPHAIVAKHGAKFMDHRIRDCISTRPASGWFQP
jgi:hypothetical protein